MSTDAGTPTPRTDHAFHGSHLQSGFVHEFARQLERELAELRTAHEAAQAEIVERDDAWMRLNRQRKFELAVAQAEIAALREDAERWRISLKLKSFPVKLGSPLYLDGGYVKWTINGDHYGLTENECADAARRKP